MTDKNHKTESGSAHWLWRFVNSWWLRTLYKAFVVVGTVALCIYMVGWAQRNGWIKVEKSANVESESTTATSTKYICPMMCVPPTTEPGRCPVCAMELVPATSGNDSGNEKSVSIATADRRLTGITTVVAKRIANTRVITVVGKLEVDESRIARIPADSAGRVEKLFFNFVGQPIQSGEKLATYYSPDLFGAQTELLTLQQTRRPSAGRRYSLASVREEIIAAARQRLKELGMTSEQIAKEQGVSASTVRTRLQRALAELRRGLETSEPRGLLALAGLPIAIPSPSAPSAVAAIALMSTSTKT
ncbi:MAG: efflux RND transporter periplasmic adaptor subunit, partial [Planctomycetota bacterium]